jgi:hypothetical protein
MTCLFKDATSPYEAFPAAATDMRVAELAAKPF